VETGVRYASIRKSGNEEDDVTATTGDVETGLSLAVADPDRLLVELPREKLAWMLQKMCEIRYFEEKAEELYIRGLVHGTMHLWGPTI